MPNCHVRHFNRLYAAVLTDLIAYVPDLRRDIELDINRLQSSSANMGVEVFLVHLPECGKVFDQALSSGRLTRSHIPFMKGYKKGTAIPRLFKGMWLRIFDVDGCLKQAIDPNLVFFMRTLFRMCKKYKMESPPGALFNATEEFYETDVSLPNPDLDWDSVSDLGFDSSNQSLYHNCPSEQDQYDLFGTEHRDDAELLDTVQRVADHVSGTIGLIETDSVRHGPGAVADSLHGVQKYGFKRWNPRLESAFPFLGVAMPLGYTGTWEESEIPSVLLAVPKTVDSPRLIAKEPVDNVFCQFSLMEGLYSRVAECWIGKSIDFRDQRPSQEAALAGSYTGAVATIDLKSASDRVSLWLVEKLFRKNQDLLWKLRSCRTGIIDLSIDKKLPKLHRLKKFSTQGAAITFPIQSLVFLSICIAAGAVTEKAQLDGRTIERLGRRVRIFGDDIIVPVDWYENTKLLLERLYLRVNSSKSHYLGKFRESCGMDAFEGFDVTPPYVSQFGDSAEPTVATSVTECSNNFFKKGLWHAASMIQSTLPKRIRDNIPVRKAGPEWDHAVGYVCLVSPSSDMDVSRERYNPDLQVFERLRLVVKTTKKKLRADDSLLLNAFLGIRHRSPIEPSYEGIDDWYPWSRWEAKARNRLSWVLP